LYVARKIKRSSLLLIGFFRLTKPQLFSGVCCLKLPRHSYNLYSSLQQYTMLISPSSGVSTDSLFNAAKPSLFTANLIFSAFFSLLREIEVVGAWARPQVDQNWTVIDY
jgi:hypothetical protein